ncbi:phosphatase PAP2 family protein [Kribbella turkmenica]|uniref:phosphatase PAP2 family protein n=1 Tax=Kribbella turkmenica TaxID=2530375 RepID=UPI0014045BDB|nr:phosphatase PAP2 family protein [Kribbella turkmenica]
MSEQDVLIWLHDDSTVARSVSDLTGLAPLAAVGIVVLTVLLSLRRWRDALFFTAAVGVVWAVNPLLKQLFGRSRPELWPLPPEVSEYSFPSGHAANTAALVGALVLIAGRLPVLLLGAVLVLIAGWAQLALGRHYPTDVLAGWLWALTFVAVVRNVTKGGPG